MSTPSTHAADRVVFIDPMTADDLACVANAEQRACAYPWSVGNFRDSLTAGYPAYMLTSSTVPTDADHCRTAQGRTLLGYWVAMRGVDEMHLLSIAVTPEHRRHGWARAMLQALIAQTLAEGLAWLWLEVRASNAPALALYKQMGFLAMGLRKQYYPAEQGSREDAIVMSLNLRAHPPTTDPV